MMIAGLVALVLSIAAVAIVLFRGFTALERSLQSCIEQSVVPELSRAIAALDSRLESAIQNSAVPALSGGASVLSPKLESAILKSMSPTIGIYDDIEDTIALVNVGGGVAIDIEWSTPDGQRFGSISFLSPEQTWHVCVRKDATERLLIMYKSLSGEKFSGNFELSQVRQSAKDCLALA